MSYQTPADIYLDANATTRVLPQAVEDAKAAMEELFGNPSSSHITGIRARHLLESTRKLAGSILGAKEGQIIYTSGATEAIQIGVFSTLCQIREKRKKGESSKGLLLYGATEHKAVPQALAHWNQMLDINDEIVEIPVDAKGLLDLDFLREHAAEADMICTMAVNNEIGAIHPLDKIEKGIRDENSSVAWLVDCVQAVGKIPLDLASTSIDYAAISGHKLHAPKGIGLLYVREGSPLIPLFAGGGQENGARSGTENLPGVAALTAVFQCLNNSEDPTFKSTDVLESYRDQIVESLKKAFPSIHFNTCFECSIPTTINFSVKGLASKEILDLFDAAGIRVSSGSACGSALQGSYVLDAMGLPAWRSEGAIRISFSPTTESHEIKAASERIEEAGKALCHSCLILSDDLTLSEDAPLDGMIELKNGSMCSWILIDAKTNEAIIVDPFKELADRIEVYIRCQKCKVVAILDSHNHVDHQSCRNELLDSLGPYITERARSKDILGWPDSPDGVAILADGSEASFIHFPSGNTTGEVIARTKLPGHTIDGQAYFVGQLSEGNILDPQNIRFAFTGDTLLIGGIGRTDFPSSSISDMYDSLHRLPQLIASDTIICPTHDYTNGFATTLSAEIRHNEYLARFLNPVTTIAPDCFESDKKKMDAGIADETNCELVCGLIDSASAEESSIDLLPENMKEYFMQHKEAWIIDVREKHEYQFAQDWDLLGLEEKPLNVPLTRFSDFLQRLLQERKSLASRDIIFVCRTGNRSSKAAEALRRMGHTNSWHISGGIALGTQPNGMSADSVDSDLEYVI